MTPAWDDGVAAGMRRRCTHSLFLDGTSLEPRERSGGDTMRKAMTWLAASIVTLTCGSQAFAGQTVVSCGSGQRAIVRNAFVRGETVTRVDCVSSGYRAAAYRTARYRTERRHRSWQKS